MPFDCGQIPEELIDSFERSRIVGFVGAGLSRAARRADGRPLPGWPDLLLEALAFYNERAGSLDAEVREEICKLIAEGDRGLIAAASYLRDEMGEERFGSFLRSVFRDPRLSPGANHELLAELPFRAIVTTNYDKLVEEVIRPGAHMRPAVFTPADLPELRTAHQSDGFYVLKAHGDIDRIRTVVLGRREYRQLMFENRDYRNYLTGLFSSCRVLFLGCSLSDPDLRLFLDDFFQSHPADHPVSWALMPLPIGRVIRSELERDYRIQVIPYDPAEQHAEVTEFLSAVRKRFRRTTSAPRILTGPSEDLVEPSFEHFAQLRKIYLRRLERELGQLEVVGLRANVPYPKVFLDLLEVFVPIHAREKEPAAVVRRELADIAGGEQPALLGNPREPLEGVLLLASDVLKRDRRTVLVGGPGSGKTTLLKRLALAVAAGDEKAILGEEEPVVPVLVPLRAFAMYLASLPEHRRSTPAPRHLLDYLAEREADWGTVGGLADAAARKGRLVVLLDGLDEIPLPADRRLVCQAISAFAAFEDNRIVVTSRPGGYEQIERLPGFRALEVQPLDDATIDRFIRGWYRGLARFLSESGVTLDRIDERAESLIEALKQGSSRVRDLARSPLLLATAALVHFNRNDLPERRAELYDWCTLTLLGWWDTHIRGVAELSPEDQALLDLPRAEDRRRVLQSIAFWMHTQSDPELGVEPGALTERIAAAFCESELETDTARAGKRAEVLLRLIRGRSGLLVEVATDRFGFAHRTFQEYLAARHIVDRDDFVDFISDHIGQDIWHEVTLLAMAHLAMQESSRLRTLLGELVRDILLRSGPDEWRTLRCSVVLADFLRDTGGRGLEPGVQEATVNWLLRVYGAMSSGDIGYWDHSKRIRAGLLEVAETQRSDDLLRSILDAVATDDRLLGQTLSEILAWQDPPTFDHADLQAWMDSADKTLRSAAADFILLTDDVPEPSVISALVDGITSLRSKQVIASLRKLLERPSTSADVRAILRRRLGQGEKRTAALLADAGETDDLVLDGLIAELSTLFAFDSGAEVARRLLANPQTSARVVEALVRGLQSPMEATRCGAAILLGEQGRTDVEVLEALIAPIAMTPDIGKSRQNLLDRLLQNPALQGDILSILRRHLESPTAHVPAFAARTLVRGGEAVTGRIIDALIGGTEQLRDAQESRQILSGFLQSENTRAATSAALSRSLREAGTVARAASALLLLDSGEKAGRLLVRALIGALSSISPFDSRGALAQLLEDPASRDLVREELLQTLEDEDGDDERRVHSIGLLLDAGEEANTSMAEALVRGLGCRVLGRARALSLTTKLLLDARTRQLMLAALKCALAEGRSDVELALSHEHGKSHPALILGTSAILLAEAGDSMWIPPFHTSGPLFTRATAGRRHSSSGLGRTRWRRSREWSSNARSRAPTLRSGRSPRRSRSALVRSQARVSTHSSKVLGRSTPA